MFVIAPIFPIIAMTAIIIAGHIPIIIGVGVKTSLHSIHVLPCAPRKQQHSKKNKLG